MTMIATENGLIPMTAEEESALAAERSVYIKKSQWAEYQAKAQAALDATDMVAIRCVKAGVSFPAAWVSYVAELREIIRANSGDPSAPLPTMPSYPAGT